MISDLIPAREAKLPQNFDPTPSSCPAGGGAFSCNAMAKINSEPFRPGDVVRLSALGRDRLRSPPNRNGVVTNISETGQKVTLRWAGLKATTVVHWTYLERAD